MTLSMYRNVKHLYYIRDISSLHSGYLFNTFGISLPYIQDIQPKVNKLLNISEKNHLLFKMIKVVFVVHVSSKKIK